MILNRLAAGARQRVEQSKNRVPLIQIKRTSLNMPGNTGFPFEQALRGPDINFICEIKKASPSKGIIAPDFPYLQIAVAYEQAGAAAISVLTEPEYFKGRDEYLEEIAHAVLIPVLRKDFTVDEYQIYEAKTLGAAAVLLICSLLDEDTISNYLGLCDQLGLSALVEAHNEREVEKALRAGARIIGVNNRNLRDFTVDLGNSIKLRRLVPDNVLFVAESGISSAADTQLLRANQVNGVLIGEALMRAVDKRALLMELRGTGA